MVNLKKLALEHNTTVVMSIHQPRSDIFHQFDSLLVLSHGKTIFSGTPQDVVPYFA
jgi:ABC-type multidrug transport system ATPase subunit